LTLNQVPFGERGALSHLGLQVASTDDVLAVRRKWNEAGLVTRDEMQTNCCYAMQDKTWVHDPDGNEWEVFVVLQDNLAETSRCCGSEQSEQLAENVSGACATEAAAPPGVASCCGANETQASPVSLSR
jgi:hypothetical protein